MPVRRKWIDLNGNLYDLWHIVSAEAVEEYSDNRGDFDFLIYLNKTAVSRDIKEVKINFLGERDKRDQQLRLIKKHLKNDSGILFIGEADIHPDQQDDDFPDF